MPQIEWFYAKNDQPCGPVSPAELRKFADEGELHREDLVWREGMGEWIPAGKIKGLFDSNGEGTPQDEAPAGEMAVAPAPPPAGEVPAGAIPNPPAAAAEFPIRATPTSDQARREAEPEPTAPVTRPEETEAETKPIPHPLDFLADLAREQFDPRFVHSAIAMFRIGGQIGIFLTIVTVLFLALAVGAKTATTLACMQLAVAAVLALLLAQYTAGRLFPAMENLDRASRAVLSATGPFDSLAWTLTALGLLSLIGLVSFAIATSMAWPAFLAIGIFVVCQFTAVVAWNPRSMWLEIGPVTTPGREAAGVLCFLGKLVWRLSMVAYSTGIVLGTIAALNVAVHIGLSDEPAPGWFTTELRVPLCLLVFALPLPVVGYIAFLVLHLLAELALVGLSDRKGER
jgi:uncharacterized protein DUF4339